MENYFQYFGEIEEHFQRRRGTALLLSTLDWALIETWKDSGVPLEAVLRGIDSAFDSFDRRPRKTRKVNSLAYCAQAVMSAAEDMQEAALGSNNTRPQDDSMQPRVIAAFLRSNAEEIERSAGELPDIAGRVAAQTVASLRASATALDESNGGAPRLEDLERQLTVLEEKLFAALLAASPDKELVAIRTEADSAMAPYRSKMKAAQIEQLHRQFVHKRLLERHKLPRLSLFYMHS